MTIATFAPALLLLSAWSFLSPFLTPDASQGRQGLSSYKRSEWSDAVERFERARDAHPDARYDFDLGASAYRAGDFGNATEAFGAAARSADLAPGHAEYNMGNALYKAGDLEGALSAYRAALRKNPGDEDARHNYELALRRMQSGEQQNQDKGEKNKDQNEQQQQQDSQGQEKPDSTQAQEQEQQQKDEQEKQQEQEQAQEQQGEEQPGEQSQDRQEEARMLTPEQAMQLLNQVTPEERELLEARLRAARRRPAEKDW